MRQIFMSRIFLGTAVLGAAFLGIAAAGGALAQGAGQAEMQVDTIVLARQAAMDMQGALATDMKRAVDAKEDVKPFKNAAIGIGKWGKAIPSMYPEASLQGTYKGTTRALPAIASKREAFQKDAANLTEAAGKLQAAAEAGDKAAFATAFKALGESCQSCHNDFRAK